MGATHGRASSNTAQARGKVGLVSCIAFAVGTMVGAGVFVLSGLAIQRTGPAAFLSFGLAGIFVLLSAMSFAVVASLAPAGGSGYAYVSSAVGRFWGFLTSWCFYLGGVIGAAFVLHAFGTYLHRFFWSGATTVVLAIGAALLITLLNFGPASAIGRAEIVLVGVKVIILLLLITFAFVHVGRVHLTPFAPHGGGSIIATSALLFVAFLGFNVVTNMAGDVVDPHRTVPLAIMISMVIVALIYLGVVLALLAGGIHRYDEGSVGTAARHLMGAWGGWLIPVAALVSTLSAANANVLGSSEIMVRLARARDVPTTLGRLWRGHPLLSVLLGACIMITLLLVGNIQSIVALSNVVAIVAMCLVNIAAAVAQHRRPAGALRLPFGLTFPILGVAAAAGQLPFVAWPELIVGLALVAVGGLVYAVRGRGYHAGHHREIVRHLDNNAGPAGRALAPRSVTRGSES